MFDSAVAIGLNKWPLPIHMKNERTFTVRISFTGCESDTYTFSDQDLPIEIGRSSSCDLSVDGAYVSRTHCRLFERDGTLWLEDLDSSNGTYEDGERISEAEITSERTFELSSVTVEVDPEKQSVKKRSRSQPLADQQNDRKSRLFSVPLLLFVVLVMGVTGLFWMTGSNGHKDKQTAESGAGRPSKTANQTESNESDVESKTSKEPSGNENTGRTGRSDPSTDEPDKPGSRDTIRREKIADRHQKLLDRLKSARSVLSEYQEDTESFGMHRLQKARNRVRTMLKNNRSFLSEHPGCLEEDPPCRNSIRVRMKNTLKTLNRVYQRQKSAKYRWFTKQVRQDIENRLYKQALNRLKTMKDTFDETDLEQKVHSFARKARRLIPRKKNIGPIQEPEKDSSDENVTKKSKEQQTDRSSPSGRSDERRRKLEQQDRQRIANRMDQIKKWFRQGDFQQALDALTELRQQLRSMRYRRRISRRKQLYQQVVSLLNELQTKIEAGNDIVQETVREGRSLRPVGINGKGITFAGDEMKVTLSWSKLGRSFSLSEVIRTSSLTDQQQFSMGLLQFHSGNREQGMAMLEGLARRSPELQRQFFDVLALHRGQKLPDRPYRKIEGRWYHPTEAKQLKQFRKQYGSQIKLAWKPSENQKFAYAQSRNDAKFFWLKGWEMTSVNPVHSSISFSKPDPKFVHLSLLLPDQVISFQKQYTSRIQSNAFDASIELSGQWTGVVRKDGRLLARIRQTVSGRTATVNTTVLYDPQEQVVYAVQFTGERKGAFGNGSDSEEEVTFQLQRTKDVEQPPTVENLCSDSERRSQKGTTARKSQGFYGYEIDANRVIFIIDASGSMRREAEFRQRVPEGETRSHGEQEEITNPSRLDVAKYEAKKAIGELASDVRFDVIFYRDDVKTWNGHLVRASKSSKDDATTFIDQQNAEGGTNIFGGLMKALNIEYESGLSQAQQPASLYLMTDGKPSSGKYQDPEKIVKQVKNRNQKIGARINTISIKGDDRFMCRLAMENNGRFVEIPAD